MCGLLYRRVFHNLIRILCTWIGLYVEKKRTKSNRLIVQLNDVQAHLLTIYMNGDELLNWMMTHKDVYSQCKSTLQALKYKKKLLKLWKKQTKRSLSYDQPMFRWLVYRFPTLNYQSHFSIGGTGYIDGITAHDVQHCIMQGTDPHGRAFMTIRYRCLDQSYLVDGTTYTLDTSAVFCLTLFQRYQDGSGWCKAGYASQHEKAPLLCDSSVGLSVQTMHLFIANLFRILSGEPYIYYDYENAQADTPTVKRYLQIKLV